MCVFDHDGVEVGGLPPARGLFPEAAGPVVVAEAVPILNSLPGAAGVFVSSTAAAGACHGRVP